MELLQKGQGEEDRSGIWGRKFEYDDKFATKDEIENEHSSASSIHGDELVADLPVDDVLIMRYPGAAA